jgi:branched-chain amino acid transport system substrate-binding protein
VALAIAQANARKLTIGGRPVDLRMQMRGRSRRPKIGTARSRRSSSMRACRGHRPPQFGVTIPASEIYNARPASRHLGLGDNPGSPKRGMKGCLRHGGTRRPAGAGDRRVHRRRPQGAQRVAIVDDKTAYGEGLANEVEKALRAAKWRMSAASALTDKDTDFKAILTRIKSRIPTSCFHGGMDATGGLMMKQARELGMKAQFAFGDGACTDEMAQLAGPRAKASRAPGGAAASAASPSSSTLPRALRRDRSCMHRSSTTRRTW